jgi:hypothetical protein
MAPAFEFAFHGEYGISQKAQIGREFEGLRATGPHATTILDLTDAGYIDTTSERDALRPKAGRPRASGRSLVRRGRNISRVFSITPLDGMFPVFATMALARDYAVARVL